MRWVLLVMTGLPPLGQTACLLSENSTAEEENQKSQPTRSLKSDPRTSFPSCNQGCLGSHVLCCGIQTKEMEFFTSKGVVLEKVQYFSDLFLRTAIDAVLSRGNPLSCGKMLHFSFMWVPRVTAIVCLTQRFYSWVPKMKVIQQWQNDKVFWYIPTYTQLGRCTQWVIWCQGSI